MSTNSIADTLSTSLGLSYGINVSDLVTSLVAASRGPKETILNKQMSDNSSRISALASAKSSLSTFSTALTELMKSSEYSGQPASSNESIASVALIPGAKGTPVGLPAQLEVKSLASAQVLRSTVIPSVTADGVTLPPVAGTGTLTLVTAKGSFDITLTSPKNTLSDLAAAINGKKAGVSASVVTDTSGSRLVLKGETGAANGFKLLAGTDTDTTAAPSEELKRFLFDPSGTSNPMTLTQDAKNAEIRIDNVDMSFETNVVDTAIANLRIDLNTASPGTLVTLATDQPKATMSELVQDFADSYNKMKSALNVSTRSSVNSPGLLSNDFGIRQMASQLSRIVGTQLSSTGPYKTLADIGVSTTKDGTLSVDTKRLEKVLSDNPEAVTQMLNPASPSDDSPGIAGALKKVTDFLNAKDGPLESSAKSYDQKKDSLQSELDKLDKRMSDYESKLTSVYTVMQTRLTAMKASQTYLTQQIASWNSSSS